MDVEAALFRLLGVQQNRGGALGHFRLERVVRRVVKNRAGAIFRGVALGLKNVLCLADTTNHLLFLQKIPAAPPATDVHNSAADPAARNENQAAAPARRNALVRGPIATSAAWPVRCRLCGTPPTRALWRGQRRPLVKVRRFFQLA
ncbi:hypothetical protein RAH42_12865 [Pyramidobacter sp. YE332]|uniref:hypothetical protein n=1 Tax=Pyramidobacter sp. YE332 TaxID=3068894 RepID=UPI00294B7DB8|nr:hypothetical protein [Pyramidobacter sp. YE332]WOL40009.1 hypothetical protein RAH42_12865 [Pyramidobacter sp. YE332]